MIIVIISVVVSVVMEVAVGIGVLMIDITRQGAVRGGRRARGRGEGTWSERRRSRSALVPFPDQISIRAGPKFAHLTRGPTPPGGGGGELRAGGAAQAAQRRAATRVPLQAAQPQVGQHHGAPPGCGQTVVELCEDSGQTVVKSARVPE
jgi:hypothetical protein